MHYLRVRLFCGLTLLLCALVALSGCGSVRYVDRVTEVSTPVRVPVDSRLTIDCEPGYQPPQSGPITLGDALARLASVEEALAQCRAQLDEIRNLK